MNDSLFTSLVCFLFAAIGYLFGQDAPNAKRSSFFLKLTSYFVGVVFLIADFYLLFEFLIHS